MSIRSKAGEKSQLASQQRQVEPDTQVCEGQTDTYFSPLRLSAVPSPQVHALQLQRLSARYAKQVAGQLQRAYGNRYVSQVAQQARQGQESRVVQPKLTVTPPNDRYEQEADRAADQVMRKIESGLEGQTDLLSGKHKKETDHPVALAMSKAQCVDGDSAGVGVSENVESVLQSARGGGQALPEQTRISMEQAFGADFKGVRVHIDSRAADISQKLNASAFTSGPDIYFSHGEYAPDKVKGQRLLAHELTHVLQQQQMRGGGIPTIEKTIQRQPTLWESLGASWKKLGGALGPSREEHEQRLAVMKFKVDLEKERNALIQAVNEAKYRLESHEGVGTQNLVQIFTRAQLHQDYPTGVDELFEQYKEYIERDKAEQADRIAKSKERLGSVNKAISQVDKYLVRSEKPRMTHA